MELTKTQRQVLKVLFENREEWLTPYEIKTKSKEPINLAHVISALRKFVSIDYVLCYSSDKFQISPDGISAYYS